MKLRVWWALAKGVMLESLRRKDLYVIAILGFLIMVSASALSYFGAEGLTMFVKDLATTVLGMFSTIVAILTASRMLPDEIRQRTLYPLLARPISRFDFLMGKLLGSVLVTWTAFLILAALTGIALAMFRVPFEAIMLQYLLLKAMGLVVVCAVSLALSCYMTPAAAATMSFIFAFGSGMIVRALTMAYQGGDTAMAPVFKAINAIIPQYGLFDIGSRVANIGWSPVPIWVVASLFVYMVVYAGTMLVLSWAKFRSQAV